MYLPRHIDSELLKWKESSSHKPLLIRGVRQVGKSSSIRNLGTRFKYFVEINLEKKPELKNTFRDIRDVRELTRRLSSYFQIPIIAGDTLLFIDEIQSCEEALKSLWFFKEDFPELHVIGAGSLLEFALKDIKGFGVGRIRSLFMYPLSFDEFMIASGKEEWVTEKKNATPRSPIFQPLHTELVNMFRTYLVIGGMPAAVSKWVETGDYLESAKELEDIQQAYYDDFAKYSGQIDPHLLRSTMLSVVMQIGKKFVYSKVEGKYGIDDVKKALTLLEDAGIIHRVRYSAGNGLPLGAETNDKFNKFLYLDSGLLLRILDLELGGSEELRHLILIDTEEELVNKGSVTEMTAGWEMIKYSSNNFQHDLYYWENLNNGATAEIDYLTARNLKVLPVEIKSGVSGKMKSLRLFMEKKDLNQGIRSSLENFGELEITADGTERRISIIPLYALSNLYPVQTASPLP